MEKRYLTVAQAASETSLNRKTVLKLIHDGHLQAARIGRIWRIDRRDFEEFMDQAKTEAVVL